MTMAKEKAIATRKIKAVRKSRPQQNERLSTGLIPRRLEAGQWVDPYTAQRVGAVWRCVQYLAGIISQLPWRVYAPRSGGGFEPLEEHTVTWLLNRRPNPEMSAFKMRETAVRHVLLRGNFIAEIERTFDGRPLWLWPIDPTRATLIRLPTGMIGYQFNNADGSQVTLPARDVFHVAGASDDGLIGIPFIYYAALSIGTARAVESYGGSFFENNGIPSGVLTHPKTLNEDAANRIEDSWRRNHGGRRTQGTVVLEEGMDYKVIGVPPEQAQFLETRRTSVEEICRWFGVPLQKVMATQQATYRNMEQFNREVITDTCVPIMRCFEQEADYKLLTDNRGGVYSRMDTRELLRGDSTERSTYWKNLFSTGSVSVNEIREAEGMPPVDGGDTRYIQVNMGSINEDGTIDRGTPAPVASPTSESEETEGVEEGGVDNDNEERPSNGDARPADERGRADRLISEVVSAIHEMRRGPRGQRGPRGSAGGNPPVALTRRDGHVVLQLQDGTMIEEQEANDGSG